MSENIYTCNICDKIFETSQGLNGHKRSHTSYKQPLYYCSSIFSKKVVPVRSLELHNQAYIKNLKKCPVCHIDHTNSTFCSRSCAATYTNKSHTTETKEKIRDKLYQYYDRYPHSSVSFRKCKKCDKSYRVKSSSQKYCSSSCNTIRMYGNACRFKLNNRDHPELFDGDLITKHGWYQPASKKNPNLGGVVWDHLYPIHEGYENNVPPEIMSHPANAEMVHQKENMRRYHEDKFQITYEQLLERIDEWKSSH